MKWGRKSADVVEPEVEDEPETPLLGKGRPTPKRRDVEGRRGPVTAPKTRKEAYARQKRQTRTARTAANKPVEKLTPAERRELMRRGDDSVLPRRDQGPTKKLARDYVDSHRMASNYLLVLFLVVLISTFAGIAILQVFALAVILLLLVEWYLTGRRVRNLAIERFGSAEGTPMGLGYYCGTRAYVPRKWRMPAPTYSIGDEI